MGSGKNSEKEEDRRQIEMMSERKKYSRLALYDTMQMEN